MTLGRLSRTLLVMAGAMGAMTVHAQSADENDTDQTPTQTGLNLPKDITVFGTYDPTVRKATAIVNGDIITDTDVDQRLAVFENGGDKLVHQRSVRAGMASRGNARGQWGTFEVG